MKSLLHALKLDFLPASSDLALLVLRVWLGASMIGLHGWKKLANFSAIAEKFPAIIINGQVSLTLAVLTEVVASVFLIAGLFGRLAALGSAITMAVAFFITHGGKLVGEGNGELAFLYLAGYVVLLIAGPGRFSMDRAL